MQLIRCSACHRRPSDVPATLFWSWRTPDGARHAYKQRLCVDCYAITVAPLEVDYDGDRLRCPGCGIDTEDTYIPTYANVFQKKYGRTDLTLPLCASCSDQVRQRAQLGSEELPDRDVGAADAAPTYSTAATLRALGREL